MKIVPTRIKLHGYNDGIAVRLPDYVVEALNLKKGDKVEFYINDKDVKIRKADAK